MKLKQIFRHLFGRKEKPSWKDRYQIGRGTYGEPTIRHWGEPTTLRMGNHCSIATGVTIFLGGNHRTDWITTYPFSVFRDSAHHIPGHPASRGDVVIGHDVWIGSGAVILSGVHIGNGAVIGASAVVSKDVPAYGIVAGNPARLVKMRFDDADIARLQALQWWDWSEDTLDAAMETLLSGDVASLWDFAVERGLCVSDAKPESAFQALAA